jgi:predicted nucleic acid-binding protein
MTVLAFVDTNVVVYAVGQDTARREKAIQLLTAGAVVSVQVINETISVLLGKQRFVKAEAYEIAESLMVLCEVVSIDTNTVRDTRSNTPCFPPFPFSLGRVNYCLRHVEWLRYALFRRHAAWASF